MTDRKPDPIADGVGNLRKAFETMGGDLAKAGGNPAMEAALGKCLDEIARIELLIMRCAYDDMAPRHGTLRPVTKGHEGRSDPETAAEQLARIDLSDLATLLAKVAEKDSP